MTKDFVFELKANGYELTAAFERSFIWHYWSEFQL